MIMVFLVQVLETLLSQSYNFLIKLHLLVQSSAGKHDSSRTGPVLVVRSVTSWSQEFYCLTPPKPCIRKKAAAPAVA